MFQKEMEGMAMVVVTQMTKFMQEDIVLKDLGKTYYVEIQIYVIACGTAAPVGGIMLYRDLVIYEAISFRQFSETLRQF